MPQSSTKTLSIRNLIAGPKDRVILRSVNLTAKPNVITALMGPNGSGKSTLAHVLMGHPDYQVTKGVVMWRGKNLLKLTPAERARLGVFLAFQYPLEISGVNYHEFLWTAYQAVRGKTAKRTDFDSLLKASLKELTLSERFLDRSVNEGFSGGEKKKAEMLQLLILQPKLIILDETDSGLDIDALKLIAKTVKKLIARDRVILVITHYQKLLNALKPRAVHVLHNGVIVASGSGELVKKLERQGYGWLDQLASKR